MINGWKTENSRSGFWVLRINISMDLTGLVDQVLHQLRGGALGPDQGQHGRRGVEERLPEIDLARRNMRSLYQPAVNVFDSP
ncbi:MAG TPA: hypothetical protein VLC49_03285 [Solirubrobacteraceae bacterium]|nr:hypothetical protein [Solirubrobacteraceae bacterium]